MRRVVFLAALAMAGCRDKSVAEVTKHHGDLTHDTFTTQQKWEAAADGQKLGIGDGLKTGPGAEASVHLTRGGSIKLPPDTTIRFLASKPGTDARLAVETGEASVDAEGSEVVIETSIGTAHIEAGGQLKINAGRLEVSIGAARLDTPDGGVTLSPGKAFDIALGGAIVEKETPDASVDASVDAAPPAPVGSTVVDGKGARRQAKGSTVWTPLAEGGVNVANGDTIDAPAGVDVSRGSARARVKGRFVVGDADDGVKVDVPGGSVVSTGRLDAEIAAAGTKITVRQGEAEVRGATTETVRAGESAVLSPKGVVTITGRGPAVADFAIKAGESIVIRDGRAPTALGFDVSAACPGAAIVTRDETTTVRGEKKANLFIPLGAHKYAVHCIGADGIDPAVAASGTVTVIGDSARADLPRIAPSSVVDTDGRRYTILYQNLLPSLVVRWMDAPSTRGFALSVDGKRQPSDTARATIRAGNLAEGTHTLKFETADGSKASAETTVVVKFDNAAPAAQIREPADGSFGPADTVKVAGLVSEG